MVNVQPIFDAYDCEYQLIPVRPNTKVGTKNWNTVDYSLEWIVRSVREGWNVGLRIPPGLCVIDRDSGYSKVRQWVKEHVPPSPMEIITASGKRHTYVQLPEGVESTTKIRLQDMSLDAKTTGYMVYPPSRIGDGEYRIPRGKEVVPLAHLPVFEDAAGIFTQEPEERPTLSRATHAATKEIANPRAYCLAIPSIQGQNGSKGLVRVVCVLWACGWSQQEIFDFVSGEWNQKPTTNPPWSEKEILHCIQRHCK